MYFKLNVIFWKKKILMAVSAIFSAPSFVKEGKWPFGGPTVCVRPLLKHVNHVTTNFLEILKVMTLHVTVLISYNR
jgi:hypothetical protein